MKPTAALELDVDAELVAHALEGSGAALRALVARHQPFIFNLALKLFGSRADAEDVTQEVLVKAITSLDTFRGQSAFRTWLYSITVRHVRRTRRRGLELGATDFEAYFDQIAEVPDEPWLHGEETVEELRLRCTSGMLMCLSREQRLVYLLGAVFSVPHTVAAEVLGVSPGAYRVRLHRARAELSEWMTRRCGLIDPANPCRCEKKTRAYVRAGLVDPQRLVFNADFVARIGEATREGAAAALEVIDSLCDAEFRRHPFQVSSADVVEALLGNPTLRAFFVLDEPK